MISQSHRAPWRAREEFSHLPHLGVRCPLGVMPLAVWALDLLTTAANEVVRAWASLQLLSPPPPALGPNFNPSHMVGGEKSFPFPPTPPTGPFAWPRCGDERESVGAGHRSRSRAPVGTGAAGPFATLLSPSLPPAPPNPSPLQRRGPLLRLTTIYVPDNSTHHRANFPITVPTEQLDNL